MAQVAKNVQNSFIAGLKTEYTALNFPENAATDCSNCVFSLIGDVTRRGGIDYETNGSIIGITTANLAINSYKWDNVGGDGLTQMVVEQVGGTINFFKSSDATTSSPLSTKRISATVTLSTFVASGGSFDATKECQFADGNGYLFIFHPNCDPIVVTYNSGNNTVSASAIAIQIRDFAGIPESGVPVGFRPNTLTPEHQYNLQNQGWTALPVWTATSTSFNLGSVGSHTWVIQTGIAAIAPGQVVTIVGDTNFGPITMSGTVTSYNTGNGQLVVNVTSSSGGGPSSVHWTFTQSGASNTITIWHNAQGNYPSNSDVWWLFKDVNGNFNPSATVVANVTQNVGQAPQGHYIMSAFTQDRSSLSAISGLTAVTTTVRPRTGCWFQGRVFYSGVDASQQAAGDAPYTTWTESIYFSQIITNNSQFGYCYQDNDPTSENFFDLLPSDGGVIVIQGTGSIYKLFPVQNGLLVFAANGIWFITGRQGIGFTANDYTITKISGVMSVSGTSFVNVLGWPYFWNIEGIYTVIPSSQGGGLQVANLVLGNILSFYQEIPQTSKLYARGAYDAINYQLQWIYKNTVETGIGDRYKYDSILVMNTVEIRSEVSKEGKAFYPYSIETGTNFPYINGIVYVANPTGGTTVPLPVFKYLVSIDTTLTFAEENNFTTFTDWKTVDGTGKDAEAFAITGYNLKPQHHPYYNYYSQALVKHSVSYVNVFIRNSANNSYLFNSLWDYAISSDTGKFSSQQQVTNNLTSAKYQYKTNRLRVRGRGYALQLQFRSMPGLPMDIVGWSVFESVQDAP